MYLKMLVKDYKRKKVVTIVLFMFILLAATLAAGGARMFLSLTGAMDNMFRIANTPHYYQVHKGSYDEDYVRKWAEENSLVKEWSYSENLVPVDVSLYFNGSTDKLDVKSSLLFFIKQNENVDILMTLENKPVTVSDGQIAIPAIFTQWTDLKIGDTLTVNFGDYNKNFIICDLVRDSLLGSTMMSTKRLVLSENDFAEMKQKGTDVNTSFSFVLNFENQIFDFSKSLQSSDMPQNDFYIDMSLCRLAYGVSNGITIGLILMCSLLLVFIAFLTLRYTILSTIEEEFREIGVMKAIGFKPFGIIRFYMSKYIILSSAACVVGFVLGQLLLQLLSTNILLYLGSPENSASGIIASIGSVIIISHIEQLSKK